MRKVFLIVISSVWVLMPFCCMAQWNLSVTGNIRWCREKITIDQSVLAVPPYTIRSKYVILPGVGVHIDCHLSPSFFLRSGLVVDGKGTKFTDPGSIAGPNEVLYYHSYVYLDVPLFVIVSPGLFNTHNLYGGLGPFIGYGLGGWFKNEDISTDEVLIRGKVRFRGNKGEVLKDFDNGISFLIGYRLNKHFSVHFIYQYGLMDIYNGPSTAYTRTLSAGIDYKIR